ncbi:hypothetical protein AM587_10015135 [Phytophthora nicotianae]|uniref:Uncharacterized protein n=1 Tax=Phytophthora nicotianae TaxID=4792 RepID=A0A0W8CKG8_PHYNI|nr:hypothetical protein AM587_10007941 [Phytophthora nicotianae]KUF84653.1 hypothetical protein AM587_10015135 [Phytophthora nicotianae]
MECKSALKMRWTTVEVSMLTEEWANVCDSPDCKRLKGDNLSQVIFDRYNARCARTRQLRRSPQAVATQRDRMFRFAQFVANFDRAAPAKGSRVWFDLSSEEQLRVDIPMVWRRQLTTFTPDIFDTFKRSILPAENGENRKRAKKSVINNKKVKSQSSTKRQKVSAYVEPQPCWSTDEKVKLVKRCVRVMKLKGITLEDVEEMTYDKSFKCLASSKRSSFSAWRKLRTLLSSWRFICSFNVKHQPGWFELMETERDLLIAWGDLPDNFEDIEGQVFAAMEDLAPKDIKDVKEERNPLVQSPGPPSPKAISPLKPAPLGPIPLLTDLCPKAVNSEATETDDTIQRLLLEDEANDEFQEAEDCVIEPLDGRSFVPESCIFVTERTNELTGTPPGKQEVVPDPPLEPAPIYPTERNVKPLELALQARKDKLSAAFHQLRATVDQANKNTLESIGAMNADQFTNNTVGSLKHLRMVLEQQNKRLLSVLHLAEETRRQNDAETAYLMQNLFGNILNSSCNGPVGLDVVVHVPAQNGLAL